MAPSAEGLNLMLALCRNVSAHSTPAFGRPRLAEIAAAHVAMCAANRTDALGTVTLQTNGAYSDIKRMICPPCASLPGAGIPPASARPRRGKRAGSAAGRYSCKQSHERKRCVRCCEQTRRQVDTCGGDDVAQRPARFGRAPLKRPQAEPSRAGNIGRAATSRRYTELFCKQKRHVAPRNPRQGSGRRPIRQGQPAKA